MDERRGGELGSQSPEVEHRTLNSTPLALESHSGPHRCDDLVVRGSLDHPETFVVDTTAILVGKAKDFKLQPRDIVYVSRNPWVAAGEIVDMAAKSFVQAALVQATTLHVAPLSR